MTSPESLMTQKIKTQTTEVYCMTGAKTSATTTTLMATKRTCLLWVNCPWERTAEMEAAPRVFCRATLAGAEPPEWSGQHFLTSFDDACALYRGSVAPALYILKVFSSCTPPLKCSVTTTVHRRVFLQGGDKLEVLLQTPPDYTPPTSSQPTQSTTTITTPTVVASATATTTIMSSPTTIDQTTTQQYLDQVTTSWPLHPATHQPQEEPSLPSPPDQQPQPQQSQLLQPSQPQAINNTHLYSREDHPAHPQLAPTRRKKRQVVGGAPHFPQLPTTTRKPPGVVRLQLASKSGGENSAEEDGEEDPTSTSVMAEAGNQTSSSPLTIWKASVAEWASCSTREGSQVGESGPEGVVTVSPRYLQVGTNYFIGRSSWSSTECFKLQVMVRSAECGEGSLCSGKGACYTKPDMEHFQCQCCEGYMGTHCEEMNACVADPCLNAGLCVDIQEGHDGDTFQCLCPYGYRGRYCEEETNLCDSGPCNNGATCTGTHTSYTCHCTQGWTGPQCSQRTNIVHYCDKDSCPHGVCLETKEGFRCFCQPGFGGEHCEFEYNECESNPCVNGGICIDQVGNYLCKCGRGYTGLHCQVKYDLCSPDPCPANRVCVDKGNNYSCECLTGLSEDNCGPHRQLCSPNPCDNGGTCWIVPEARLFFCACRPGFTGTTCQDEAVPETVGAVGTVEPVALDVHQHSGKPLNHMKNIYVAFATLASALLIFMLVVGVCHCRVNRTYRMCFVKLPRRGKVLPAVRRPRPTSFFDKSRRSDRKGSLRLEADSDGAAMPMTSSNSNSDAVYYNMDVCDNQELPLIK
ncbi:delta and Notch-like epidermal growth factor-related receptor isoform X2 [Homarus americanus]|uniref:delta and Notch-like epidermal growth factor-related receptor isoform X2 n=1 Tax=Homarus americanus TaxID=6706 RepID=UPI001C43F8F9|nr:delta and Notch-like epidermal growth factor-related receptor isoform X2 [Homarus americanus]